MSLNAWLARPQKYLGSVGLVVLLVIAALATPISLDMYTPAIPHMTGYFNTNAGMVNLTLVGYFLFFAVGLLLFGPISDKIGRKPVLVVGSIAYAAASALCAISPTIEFLIGTRVIQALGAGAVNAIATAVVKDAIVKEKRAAMLAFVQVMAVVGPVLAPVIGAAVLMVADWHMTFWILAVVGVLCVVLSVMFSETLPEEERITESGLRSLAGLGSVAKNKGFSLYLGITALITLPYMAYIAVASHIYITFFGRTEFEYSAFFAAAAVVSAIGPFIAVVARRHLTPKNITTMLLFLALISGVAILVVGEVSPFIFCGLFLVFALVEAAIRPLSVDILLAQQDKDAGAASSLINFTHTALGTVGMAIAVLPWPNYVFGIGATIVIAMVLSLVMWFAMIRKRILIKGMSTG